MEPEIKILIVEDSVDDVLLMEHQLRKEGVLFNTLIVEDRESYEKALSKFKPDIIVSDHSLPQFDSLAALKIFQSYKKIYNPAAVFILVTGTVSEEFAVQIMKSGADDYILKDRLTRLPSAIMNALEKNRLKVKNRKKEEEKLYLLDILQQSLHETFVFDPEDLLFEYSNEAASKNLGYTKEELKKMSPPDLLEEFNEEALRKILAGVKNSRKGRVYETYATRKDGSRYPIQIHLKLIEQGTKSKFLANVLDITESRKHAEQKELAMFIQNCFNEERSLQESLELVLKELATRCKTPAAEVWAKDFMDVDIKRYGSWSNGIPLSEEEGKAIAEKAFKSGGVEEEQRPADSVFRKVIAFPIRSGNEISAVIVGYLQDLKEERRPSQVFKEGVQDKLSGNIKRKKTEEELQKIFQFSPDILVILGKDGYVRKVNPALRNILGYTQEEILAIEYDRLIHPDDVKILQEWRSIDLKEDEVAHYESRWLAKSGEFRWIAWSVTPFLKGGLNFAVGKDITDHKHRIQAIEAQNKKLSEIAWEQSHTVRAPLTRLMACIAYLEEYDEKKEEVLESIKISAHELDKIVKGIVNKTELIKYEEKRN